MTDPSSIKPISILFSSDHHFGDPSMDQQDMAEAFAEVIFPQLSKTDIFFINGDFFDRMVIFDSLGFDPIHDVIIDVFNLCETYGITLRLLQGTWTHDREQGRRFETFYRKRNYSFDFRWVQTIDLETITIRDRPLRIAYVPDDLPYKTSDAIIQVVENKMAELGWDYLDYACMHGFFDFTVPAAVSPDSTVVYREDQLPFVRKMVNVGHVHQNRTSGKVISNGSFDRHVFGDEDPKGCVAVLDYPDHYTAHFLENKNAAIFDTIVFDTSDTTETIVAKVNAHMAKIDSKRVISLRFIVDILEQREAIKSWMKDAYPDVRFVPKKSKDAKGKPMITASSVLITPTEKKVAPTPQTLSAFIRADMPDDYVLTTDAIDAYLEPVSDRI